MKILYKKITGHAPPRIRLTVKHINDKRQIPLQSREQYQRRRDRRAYDHKNERQSQFMNHTRTNMHIGVGLPLDHPLYRDEPGGETGCEQQYQYDDRCHNQQR